MAIEPSGQTWSNSDAYEAIMGRWSRPAAEVVVDWLNMPPGLAWLDVGCGTGALTEAVLARATPSAILGVEPSPEFLERARARVRDERVTFSGGNAQKLPTQDDTFDIVISGLVLHFLADPSLALREMARVVRPGGTVAGYIWALANEHQFTRPFWRAALDLDPSSMDWDPLRTHPLNDLERLSSLFAETSLDPVSTATLTVPVIYRDFDDYWLPCLLDGTTPIQRYVHSLPVDQQVRLRERLRAELPVEPDGSIPLLGILWVARGVTSA